MSNRLRAVSRHFLSRPHMLRRILILLASVCCMGVCVAVFDQIRFGTDPCSVLNLAMSRRLNMDFGTYQLLWNIVLVVIILSLKEWRRIGLGTLANMTLVGYAADFSHWVIDRIHPLTEETLLVKSIVFLPFMALFLIAVSFYIAVDLGVAPYDAIPQIISGRQHRFRFSQIRVAWDICATILGFLLGGTVGVVTVITGFCLGPLISAVSQWLTKFL